MKKINKSKYIIRKSKKNTLSEPVVAYGEKSFLVTLGGRSKRYSVDQGYGYFISSLKKAGNLEEVSGHLERGIPSKEIKPVVRYLDFKVPEIAKTASVSASTVLRWQPDTSIGPSGSGQFYKIDEIIRKGVSLFGGEEQFKTWLKSPNLSLGNALPIELITSLVGVDLVDEALDALIYGNVM